MAGRKHIRDELVTMHVVPRRALLLVSLILSGPKFSVCVSLAFSIDFVTETSARPGRLAGWVGAFSGFTAADAAGRWAGRSGGPRTGSGRGNPLPDTGAPRAVRPTSRRCENLR